MQTHELTYCLWNNPKQHTKRGNLEELHMFLQCMQTKGIYSNRFAEGVPFQEVKPVHNDLPEFITHNVIRPLQGVMERQETKNKPEVVLRKIRNREHEKVYVTLQDATTCTCIETGISYKVNLPMSLDVHMQTIHPFAFFSNVQDAVRSFGNKGVYLEKALERQDIAGMLITALRHHKLLKCSDFVSANLCLQRAKAETLSVLTRYFTNARSTKDMPSLRLVPEALYDTGYIPYGLSKEALISDRVEIMLINFLRVCKGEGEGNTRHISVDRTSSKSAGSVRIYGGNFSIEKRQADASQKNAYVLLEKLEHEIQDISNVFVEWLEGKIDAFVFLGGEQREQIAKLIREKFGEQKTAKELARLFGSVKTETLELGLETFSHKHGDDPLFDGTDTQHTQHTQINTGKKKFDLLSKLQSVTKE